MLRTNNAFLLYIEELYDAQHRKEDILLKEFPEDQILLRQGEKPAKVWILKEGIVKCYFDEAGDKGFIVEFLGKGEIFGELEIVKHIPCLCNIKTLTRVKAYAISIPYFRSLLEKELPFNKLLLESFAERVINTSTRASFQQLHTVERTLSQLLQLLKEQQMNISKEDMAAYLGITIRSLNRALKKLKPESGH
jgi:CRP/FNR family transcriptional regulator, anaerobic regulatory protein